VAESIDPTVRVVEKQKSSRNKKSTTDHLIQEPGETSMTSSRPEKQPLEQVVASATTHGQLVEAIEPAHSDKVQTQGKN